MLLLATACWARRVWRMASFWMGIVFLLTMILELEKLNTYFSPFYGHFSSYSSFHLLFSWAWPLKWSEAQRHRPPYGCAIERLVLWKKVFNCIWHFKVRHWGNHLVDSRCSLHCWQLTPMAFETGCDESIGLSNTSSHPVQRSKSSYLGGFPYDLSLKKDVLKSIQCFGQLLRPKKQKKYFLNHR